LQTAFDQPPPETHAIRFDLKEIQFERRAVPLIDPYLDKPNHLSVAFQPTFSTFQFAKRCQCFRICGRYIAGETALTVTNLGPRRFQFGFRQTDTAVPLAAKFNGQTEPNGCGVVATGTDKLFGLVLKIDRRIWFQTGLKHTRSGSLHFKAGRCKIAIGRKPMSHQVDWSRTLYLVPVCRRRLGDRQALRPQKTGCAYQDHA
jgi:hypothetical protein